MATGLPHIWQIPSSTGKDNAIKCKLKFIVGAQSVDKTFTGQSLVFTVALKDVSFEP